jgi:hypothetical protein
MRDLKFQRTLEAIFDGVHANNSSLKNFGQIEDST